VVSVAAVTQRGDLAKKSTNPPRRNLARDDEHVACVDGVNLQNVLPQIEPDARDRQMINDRLAHRRLRYHARTRLTSRPVAP